MPHYTYKYRLYPNDKQVKKLAGMFGTCRWLHNFFLEKKNKNYLDNKTSSTYYQDSEVLTKLKKVYVWMSETNSQSLQQELKNLDTSFGRFFRKISNFPRFHTKHDKQAFRVPQKVRVDNKTLFIPKFNEGIKFKQHRKVEGTIRHATISKNKAGQHFVCICAEKNIDRMPQTNKEVGIDLGIKTLIQCSDGKKYLNVKPYRTLEFRVKLLQKEVSRKVKGSINRNKARVMLARLHQRISDIRTNHLHQITRRIINENQVVVIEDLNVKGMLRNHKLAKAIQDVSLHELKRQLEYKAEWYGRTLVQIDRWYPSSKTCNECGFINQNLTLNDREWTCPRCNVEHDRDLNASINILNEGKRTAGSAGLAYCPDVSPAVKRRQLAG